MPTLILINPASGRHITIEKLRAKVEKRFHKHGEAVEFYSPPDVHSWGERITAAVEEGFDKIIAAGGDGSVHLSLQKLDFDNVALGIIPLGSGNDIYRMFGIPPTVDAAVDNFFAGVESIDLGEANGRYFLNTAGCGLDSQTLIVRENSYGWAARNYVIQFLKTLGKLKPHDFEIRIDDVTIKRRAFWVVAANNRFIGGGMKLAPEAGLKDGLLDVILVGALSKPGLVMQIPRIFKGTHVEHPEVEQFRGRKVIICAETNIPCAVDGELYGNTPLEIVLHPGKLKIRGKLKMV